MSPQNKRDIIIVPCWHCGDLMRVSLQPETRCFCPECELKVKQCYSETLNEYLRLRTILMHERALRILEGQAVQMYNYKDAADAVLEVALENHDKFDSAHEMVAAMELLRQRIKMKIHYSIGGYQVDFYLEPLKALLEIDGYMHKYHQGRDGKRDIELKTALGADWEIIRIPTKYIEKDVTQLVPAIKEIREYKQKIRRENSGILPEWYSKREKEYYGKLLKGQAKNVKIPCHLSK